MKRLLLPILIVGACTPDIEKETRPRIVTAEFDPAASVVPLPNDLARDPTTGKIVVPASATDTAAQKEFNQQYLGELTGFPSESTAQVSFDGDLDPATVNPQTVLGIDLTAAPAPIAITPVLTGRTITVAPPQGGWQRAHRYAIVVVGGPTGMRGAGNIDVVGSPTWALVSSPNPVVTCTDLTSPTCAPAVDVIPSDKNDPAERLADQTHKAIQLEQIRRGYAPLFDALAARGIPRSSIPVLWTFSIVDAAEMTFDPANNVVPFPNDALRANGKVNLPNPKTGQPLTAQDCAAPADTSIQLYCGLNTLDGFSTITAPVSESSDTLAALTQGNLDPATVNAKSVGLAPLVSQAPEATRTQPKVAPCVSCLSSSPNQPEQLQWRLEAPLDEKTTYLAFATNELKDKTGKQVIASPSFALLRSKATLVENDKSAVNILSDEQAKRLEPLRAALAPALDGLEAKGVPRASLVLAFAFTTQSEGTLLDQLYGVPAKVPGLPAAPTFVADATAQYTAAAGAAGVPIDGVSKFYAGEMITPVAITGPGGTLDVAAPKPEPVAFVMAVPTTPAPPAGYPVTIFGHGLTRSRNDLLPIANALAKAGQVVIATDALFHGERSSCTGSKLATKQASDDAACADPAAQKCDEDALIGRCVARNDGDRNACTPGPAGDATCRGAGQGRCVAGDSKCEGGDFARDASGRPNISGWNIFNLANFFATRDNFRQQVIDLSQLVRIIKGTGAGSLAQGAAITLDGATIHYVGQSLGGILGTLFTAASPDTSRVVLNVPAGTLPQVILTAPAFEAQKTAFLEGLAQQGIMPGTPTFDRFIGVAQWVVDPADPANMAYRVAHPPAANANRKLFIQFIEGDQTLPNPTNLAVVMGANRSFVPTPPAFGCTDPVLCYEFTEQGDAFDATSATPASRHGFLLAPPQGSRGVALTTKAQGQVATFIATGSVP